MGEASRRKKERREGNGDPIAAIPGGPYLQAAFFCEKILVEQDSVVSFIRQVDRLTTTASGPAVPASMPTTTFTTFLAIALKSGEARGTHDIKLVRERPSGIRDNQPVFSVRLLFEGEDRGVGLHGPANLTFEEEGLYWFDLYVDETLMTRMPFRVIYQQAVARTG